MTATAADDTPARARAVGRPGKATLAGAAVAGAILVSVPFLLLGRGDGDHPVKTANAAPGAVLDGGDEHEAPGVFTPASPEPGDEDKAGQETPQDDERGAPAPTKGEEDVDKPPADEEEPAGGKSDAKKAAGHSKSADESRSADGDENKERTKPKVTLGAPVSFRGHESGRCLDVPAGRFHDGMALQIWNCNGSNAQKWRIASDGTIRIGGKCLDVANADFHNGTTIQLAWCNGNIAQQFTLNERHDLVNTAVGMCVDVAAHHTDNGSRVQLWTCNGQDNQKWSFG
jgi:hypothetical protein